MKMIPTAVDDTQTRDDMRCSTKMIPAAVRMVTIKSSRGALTLRPTVGAKVSTIYGSAVNLGVTQVLDL